MLADLMPMRFLPAALVRQRPMEDLLGTPRQAASPSYPICDDGACSGGWNLVRSVAQVRAQGGEIMELFGQVLDGQGNPVEGARVEIWQCDVNGKHVYQDDAFSGFGTRVTGDEGYYRFRTIHPVAERDRAPHIHACVSIADRPVLVTQLYLLDDPANDDDIHFRSLRPGHQARVMIDPVRMDDGDWEAGFNFVV